MKKIPIKYKDKFYYSLVDDEDYEIYKDFKWNFSGSKYARNALYLNKRQKVRYLHRLIMNCPNNMYVDHINHDKLDNRKCNLRICTHAQNMKNIKKKTKNKTSKYKGVHFFKSGQRKKRWKSEITINYKNKIVGYFHTELEAAQAYNEAANFYFGKYAYLNEI